MLLVRVFLECALGGQKLPPTYAPESNESMEPFENNISKTSITFLAVVTRILPQIHHVALTKVLPIWHNPPLLF